MRKFTLLASLALFSIPAFSDPAFLTNSIYGGVTGGMLFFNANGSVTVPGDDSSGLPQSLSVNWERSYELPASLPGDTFEVTRYNSYSVMGADITIDGQQYIQTDDIHYSPSLPDPNAYQASYGWNKDYTTAMDLSGPISVSVAGSYDVTIIPGQCCHDSLNEYEFEQDLQIERFHADGTPDPFTSLAPEPGTFALMGLALLPVGWLARRRWAIGKSASLRIQLPQ